MIFALAKLHNPDFIITNGKLLQVSLAFSRPQRTCLTLYLQWSSSESAPRSSMRHLPSYTFPREAQWNRHGAALAWPPLLLHRHTVGSNTDSQIQFK